jgi:hypothetical protein
MSSPRSWLLEAFASATIAWISFYSASSFFFSFFSYIRRFVLNSYSFNNLIYSLLLSISSFRSTNSISLSLIDYYTISRSSSRSITRLLEASSLFLVSAFTDFSSLIYKPNSCLKFPRSYLVFSRSSYTLPIRFIYIYLVRVIDIYRIVAARDRIKGQVSRGIG